jgi:uncharacterized protein (TIGR02145 family)
MGTTQLMSVPYALYANTAANGMPAGTSTGDILYWNGTTWVKVAPGTYGQSLIMCNGVPTWGGCLPIITTRAPFFIDTTFASAGGNLTSDGGSPITAKGICWSTSSNPTIALPTKTVNAPQVGEFLTSIEGLTSNTTYYVRAYATNNNGTAYGNQQVFTTRSTPVEFVSNTLIGNVAWSNSNLSVTRYRNGDLIPQVTNGAQWASLTTGAWCWYDNDSARYAATYGRLYNWYAVNDPRGLAPQGWRIPSLGDWNKMIKYLDSNADTTCINCTPSLVAGGMLKSTEDWYPPNTGATNSSLFNGKPGGTRASNGTAFLGFGYSGQWWTTTTFGPVGALRVLLYNSNSHISIANYDKPNGFSVRVVRD